MRISEAYKSFLFTAFLVAGCASSQGFDRGRMEQSLTTDKIVVSDDEIKRILGLKPQISFPFRLGVFLKGNDSDWSRNWSKLEGARNIESEGWVNELKAAGIVSNVVFVSPLTVGKYDLKNIRLGAARHGVDAVLVVESTYDVDRYNNFSAFLYLTIIGAYLVPGTHSDALVMVKGALWDVRNEYLYLTVSAEGEAKKMGPAFLLENSDSIRMARENAIVNFGAEFVKRLKTLKGVPPNPGLQPR